MKKIKTVKGYTAYETTMFETTFLGGYGVCDECNEVAEYGYLVPVLNHYQCPSCFAKWDKRCRYYEEDIPIQDKVALYYESKIPLTK